MTYATVLVNLGLVGSNASLLRAAADVADRFGCLIVATAVGEPLLIDYGGGVVSGDMIEQDWPAEHAAARAAQAECRSVLEPRGCQFEWRETSDYRSMADQCATLASVGDLVMSGMSISRLGTGPRGTSAGDLVMQAGRPVLVIPDAAAPIDLDHVMLAWKDTREARRAAADALPLLIRAAHVAVVEIAPAEELTAAQLRLNDVAAWLKRHGASAETMTAASTGEDATQLDAIAAGRGVGVIVAGAYGHNRVEEWAFGGVTRDLLLQTARCSLLSH